MAIILEIRKYIIPSQLLTMQTAMNYNHIGLILVQIK